MNRRHFLLVAVPSIVAFLLTGCGAAATRPSYEQIRVDVESGRIVIQPDTGQ